MLCLLHTLLMGDVEMKKLSWNTYATWILFTEVVGALSGWLTREGTRQYRADPAIREPMLSPPGFVFPIVWVILFALMGVGAARIYASPPSAGRSHSLALFFLQLAFNFFWSILFFNLQAFGTALIWLVILWVLILGMIISFGAVDKTAALLQVPYLLWVTFAAYLNYGIWSMNR